ncbi:MAG: hypothetical protein Q9174_005524 [Haloplaca sp. 1 TL-2023]
MGVMDYLLSLADRLSVYITKAFDTRTIWGKDIMSAAMDWPDRFTHQPFNDQSASPLFQIPPEIRNLIFRLALTAYEDSTKRYRPDAHYYRPGYTCAHKIDTNLLLTCRLVFSETARLPAQINEHVSWYHRPPPGTGTNSLFRGDDAGSLVRIRDLCTIHIFAQQYWLEGASEGFGLFVKLWQLARPTHLIMTIRHTDWWWWEVGEPIALDPKRAGRPSKWSPSCASDPFEPGSWGIYLREIPGLDKFELELETVESKKSELDAIVDRAKSWEFNLGDGRTLIINASKTRRTGWVGLPINQDFGYPNDIDDFIDQSVTTEAPTLFNGAEDTHTSSTSDPVLDPGGSTEQQTEDAKSTKDLSAARKRLEADGVDFDSASIIPRPGTEVITYYIVTLTWEAR